MRYYHIRQPDGNSVLEVFAGPGIIFKHTISPKGELLKTEKLWLDVFVELAAEDEMAIEQHRPLFARPPLPLKVIAMANGAITVNGQIWGHKSGNTIKPLVGEPFVFFGFPADAVERHLKSQWSL